MLLDGLDAQDLPAGLLLPGIQVQHLEAPEAHFQPPRLFKRASGAGAPGHPMVLVPFLDGLAEAT